MLGDGSHDYHFLKQSSLIKKLPPEKREEAVHLLSLKGKKKVDNFFLFMYGARFAGCYPYEKYPTVEALRAAKSLPPSSDWYNSLTEEDITPAEYEHAQRVWDFFDCANMEEYMLVYLICDVFLLCEIFETFREIVHDSFQLDPSWFLGIPSLAFQVMNSVSH